MSPTTGNVHGKIENSEKVIYTIDVYWVRTEWSFILYYEGSGIRYSKRHEDKIKGAIEVGIFIADSFNGEFKIVWK